MCILKKTVYLKTKFFIMKSNEKVDLTIDTIVRSENLENDSLNFILGGQVPECPDDQVNPDQCVPKSCDCQFKMCDCLIYIDVDD